MDPDGARPAAGRIRCAAAVDGIGGLTAVDGATIINERYELLAFGAKIVRRPGWAQVSRLIVTEPTAGSTAQTVEPSQLGGTRHLSAAQFAHDQRDAIALVASQDGQFQRIWMVSMRGNGSRPPHREPVATELTTTLA